MNEITTIYVLTAVIIILGLLLSKTFKDIIKAEYLKHQIFNETTKLILISTSIATGKPVEGMEELLEPFDLTELESCKKLMALSVHATHENLVNLGVIPSEDN